MRFPLKYGMLSTIKGWLSIIALAITAIKYGVTLCLPASICNVVPWTFWNFFNCSLNEFWLYLIFFVNVVLLDRVSSSSGSFSGFDYPCLINEKQSSLNDNVVTKLSGSLFWAMNSMIFVVNCSIVCSLGCCMRSKKAFDLKWHTLMIVILIWRLQIGIPAHTEIAFNIVTHNIIANKECVIGVSFFFTNLIISFGNIWVNFCKSCSILPFWWSIIKRFFKHLLDQLLEKLCDYSNWSSQFVLVQQWY